MAEELVPVFRTTDAERSARWYGRWGFDEVARHRFAPDLPVYLFLRRDGVHLHLSEHEGDAAPHSSAYFYVDDVDEVAAEFGAEVEVQPWAREVELTDPDGNRLRVGTVVA